MTARLEASQGGAGDLRETARVTRALRRAKSLGSAAFGAIPLAFGILAIAIPVLLLPVTREQSAIAPGLYAVTIVILVVSAVRLSMLIADSHPKIIAGTFWMFLYISFGVVPLAQLHTQLFGIFLIDESALTPAAIIFLVAGLAFEIGHRAGHRAPRVSPGPPAPRVLTRRRLVALSLFASLTTMYYVQSLGGPATFFQSRGAITEAYAESGLASEGSQAASAIVSSFSVGPALVALIGWLIVVRDREQRRRSDLVWLAWILALNVVVNNPISSARYWALTVLIGLFYALPGMGRRRFTWAVVLGTVGALVIFPYTDVTRYSDSEQTGEIEVVSIAEKLATKDYDQLIMTADGVSFVRDEGFSMGHQLASAGLFWVPRSMWSGKGTDTGVMIGEYYDLPNTNLSSPLPLEVWVDFGWVGLAVGFAAIGFAARRGEDRLDYSAPFGFGKTTMFALLLPLLAGYGFILMRGPLLQSMSRGAAFVVACWVVTEVIDRRRDDARAALSLAHGRTYTGEKGVWDGGARTNLGERTR